MLQTGRNMPPIDPPTPHPRVPHLRGNLHQAALDSLPWQSVEARVHQLDVIHRFRFTVPEVYVLDYHFIL